MIIQTLNLTSLVYRWKKVGILRPLLRNELSQLWGPLSTVSKTDLG